MRKWRPSGRYFFIYKVTLDISVILCYHVYIKKKKEVNTMKGRMKNAIAEVSGRIPDGYQLTYSELLRGTVQPLRILHPLRPGACRNLR